MLFCCHTRLGRTEASSFPRVSLDAGEPLDAAKFFFIMPDSVGHRQSSKPSNGLRARFPKYDYADMVALKHRLVAEGLGVRWLRLILGTSMGCFFAGDVSALLARSETSEAAPAAKP